MENKDLGASVAELRALAADEGKTSAELRDGISSVLRGIDPAILAQCGIV